MAQPPKPSWVPNFAAPIYDSTVRDINGIRRIFISPCTFPVSAWVETLFPAVVAAAFSIVQPDKKEAYHKVIGKSLTCSVKSGILATQSELNIKPGTATRFLFRSAELYDFAVWYMFLYGVAADGLANWTSGIYRNRICPDKNNPNMGYGGLWGGGLQTHGVYNTIDYEMNAGSRYAPVSVSTVTLGPSRTGFIACTAAFTLVDPIIAPTTGRIRNSTTNAIYDQHDNGDAGLFKELYPNSTWWQGQNGLDEVVTIVNEWACFIGGPPLQEVLPMVAYCQCSKFGRPD